MNEINILPLEKKNMNDLLIIEKKKRKKREKKKEKKKQGDGREECQEWDECL